MCTYSINISQGFNNVFVGCYQVCFSTQVLVCRKGKSVLGHLAEANGIAQLFHREGVVGEGARNKHCWEGGNNFTE